VNFSILIQISGWIYGVTVKNGSRLSDSSPVCRRVALFLKLFQLRFWQILYDRSA
jgi:hypothetical protein